MIQVWKHIDGFGLRYMVSVFGEVYDCIKQRLLTKSIAGKGYYSVGLAKNGKTKNYLLHRIVAKTFIPNPSGKSQVNHKNGIKTDCFIENLEWCSCRDNVNHAHMNGLVNIKGEENPSCKLTWADVSCIRSTEGRYTYSELSNMYGVSKETVRKIIKHETWKKI